MAPVAFVFEDERFLFESSTTTLKVRNLRERPRGRVLVESPGGNGWIGATGSTEIIGGEEAQRLNARVIGRYLTEEGRSVWADTVGPLDDVTIVLTPERWSSWDINRALLLDSHRKPESWVGAAVRAPGWFYARHRIHGALEYELYDMAEDPHQLGNLAWRADRTNPDADPDLIAGHEELAQRLSQLRGCTGSGCR
jgi:hypothetical protein